LFLSFLSLLACGAIQTHAQDEIVPGKDLPLSRGRMDFAECVGFSLKESPVLTGSTVDIELRRLDESDSRYAFIPSFSLRTSYLINLPQTITNPDFRRYSYGFVTENYNPVEIYFNLRARQVLTRIGILAHFQVTSDFLQRLGAGFLELEALERISALQQESIGLAERGLDAVRSRLDVGGVSSLDAQIAEQDLQLARVELDKLVGARTTILEGIKSLMGIGNQETLSLELHNVREQVVGGFNPRSVTEVEARKSSFELRIQELKRELQEKNITLSYTRFLPVLTWGVQTTDPLSGEQESGLFFSVGFELPLWDGLKRYHNVLRQKQVMRQVDAEGKTKEISFETRWSAAQRGVADAAVGVEVAGTQKRLAELRERQVEIGYNAGRISAMDFLATRRTLLENQKALVRQSLEYDKAVLAVRALSGDLVRSYVDTTVE
jgi:outer membrane protein TolC